MANKGIHKEIDSQSLPQKVYSEPTNRLPLLLEVKEAAIEMRTSPAMVYRLINSGLLPVLKLGRIKVPYKAIVEFVDRYIDYDVTNPESVHKLSKAELAQ